MKNPIILILGLCLMLVGCAEDQKVKEEVQNINVNVKVLRFDRDFAEAGPLDIPGLKNTYPYLFPAQYPDSVWEAKLKDTLQVELLYEVGKAFPNFNNETQDLELFFKHVKYYFPNISLPTVVTITSDVDYNNRIILADSLLIIGLDNYLGQDHKFYGGIQKYISFGLDKEYMVSDVAAAFAKKVNPYPRDRAFLSQLIYYGKELYLKDKLLPLKSDAIKIGYSQEELDWAKANEEMIWRYFIERELLYSTDTKLAMRFLDQAPFSKFQLELDNESPGRIGRYIGWEIVRSFMEKNNVTLQQLLSLSAEEVFKRSKYKPNK
ncbi:gliding motility protein GldB [Sediminicola sp. YIK13]|uniref:gliding motility lipoprotein GldB n=1 Tax=Sediminicola sp. YIK13 TaxID=1453352 RepID=UPI00071FB7AE|nr:gliding motility lipoprotein GldB [Sediminicola sp. YIK13]ALM09019.1 gliding motility protein GldB [Sediminicola sp. YIK13]